MNANYKSIILVISLFFALSASISAASGDLDLTFGSDGIVITRGSNPNHLNSVTSMAIQSDGKIIVVGDGTLGTFHWDFAVVRYNTDGSLDSSFGGTGIVITPLTGNYDGASSVAIQADGKIVVAGVRYRCFTECADTSFAVVRYNPNGTLDTAFNGTGIVITSVGNSLRDNANSVAIQSDGKIVVGGSSGSNRDFAIVRYNTDGSLDTTFNGTGKVITPVGGGNFSGGANSVAIQSDGKIITAGVSQNGFSTVTVVRYNTDGTLDTSFNGTGKVITSVGNSDSGASELAIQTDGKIVVAGYSVRIPGNFITADFALVRYNPDGSLDTSFNGTGKVITSVSNSDCIAYSVAIQSDGKIVAAGYSRNDIGSDFAVVRFNPNGSLDTTFNGTGKVTTGFGGQDYAVAAAIQADGRIVVAGSTDNQLWDFYDFVVVRYQGGGATPTPTPTPTPTATPTPTPTPLPTPSATPRVNGKIAFTSDRDGNPEIYVMNADGTNQVRLTNNSVVDDQSSWSPDGTKIAFVSQTASGGSAIFMMNADGTNKVEITRINVGGPISWSPDGNRIAFQDTSPPNAHIAIVDINGSNRRNLTDSPQYESEPSWSPDGSQILFTKLVSGSPLLHTIRPDGTNLQALPHASGADFLPKWSPSGNKIAFLVNVFDFWISIFTANADGTNRQFFDGCGPTLVDNCGTDRLGINWSPDGTKIVFDVSDYFRVDSEIYVKNINGTGHAQLTNTPGRNSTPSWQPLPSAACPNPIDCPDFFVRQHYLDFLDRVPEPSGLAAWLGVLNNCAVGDLTCQHEQRLTTSAAFFGSAEFQLKGYFAFRFYRTAFARLPEYSEIAADMTSVSGQTPDDVYARKATFTNGFVQRPEFVTLFNGLPSADYVGALMSRYNLNSIITPDPSQPNGTTKVTLTESQLVSHLNAGTLTRAQVLRAIADSDQVLQLEFNRAFVAMQYYGYLRRAPETTGYNSWLNYLNAHPGDFREMVRGFVDSTEYRRRFGEP